MTKKKYFSRVDPSSTLAAWFFLLVMGLAISLFFGFDACPSLDLFEKIKCYVGNVAGILSIVLGIYLLLDTLLKKIMNKSNKPILIVGSSYLEFDEYKIPLSDINDFYIWLFDILYLTTSHPVKKYLIKWNLYGHFWQIFVNIIPILVKVYSPILILFRWKTKMRVTYNITLFSKHIIHPEEFDEISAILSKSTKK